MALAHSAGMFLVEPPLLLNILLGLCATMQGCAGVTVTVQQRMIAAPAASTAASVQQHTFTGMATLSASQASMQHSP